MSRILRIGDKVKISEDACLMTYGELVKTASAGYEGIITSMRNANGNCTLDVPGLGRNFNCLPEYLTFISSSAEQILDNTQEPNSVYCSCNGPARETGIGMLVFSVCTICKKEKQ